MLNCHRCGEPILSECVQSMGRNWHSGCLSCYDCGKPLNPRAHAEHNGAPFCAVPCLGKLFGADLASRSELAPANVPAADGMVRTHVQAIESSAFGDGEGVEPAPRLTSQPPPSVLQRKLKAYNKFNKHFQGAIQSRESGERLVLNGVLKLYWGVTKVLQFKEQDDQRPIVKNKRLIHKDQTDRAQIENSDSESDSDSLDESVRHSSPLPPPARRNQSRHQKRHSATDGVAAQTVSPGLLETDIDAVDSLSSNSAETSDSSAAADDAAAAALPLSCQSREGTPPDDEVRLRRPTGSRGLHRRFGRRFNGGRLQRRCSINGHFYNRETSVFRPPSGSILSVWVTSLITAADVIKLVLQKYRVEADPSWFAIYIFWDSGERRRLRDDEFPLVTRVMIGPSESAARLFIKDADQTVEINRHMALYINLTEVECTTILQKFHEEEETQILKITQKYADAKKFIRTRMQELKQCC